MGTWQGGYIYRNDPALITLNAAILAERSPAAVRQAVYRGLPPHGTMARYRRHLLASEKACLACLAANCQYEVQRRQRRRQLRRKKAER